MQKFCLIINRTAWDDVVTMAKKARLNAFQAVLVKFLNLQKFLAVSFIFLSLCLLLQGAYVKNKITKKKSYITCVHLPSHPLWLPFLLFSDVVI